MLILIAEAKTMAGEERPVDLSEFKEHTPALEEMADMLMAEFAKMTVAEISSLTGLTPTLASRQYKYAYEFPDKRTGMSAICAYTGVVFKAFDYPSLSEQAKGLCEDRVRIISSLYGWLRPLDIVKPYRLDYTSKLPVNGTAEPSAASFWKKDVTILLVKELQAQGHKEILNLLPSDAAKCIDWKLVKNFAKVWKADFTDALTGGTPSATKLKNLRGQLLRQLLLEEVGSVAAIMKLVSDAFVCEGTPRYPDHLHFLC